MGDEVEEEVGRAASVIGATSKGGLKVKIEVSAECCAYTVGLSGPRRRAVSLASLISLWQGRRPVVSTKDGGRPHC
jgi:hypothetical protein